MSSFPQNRALIGVMVFRYYQNDNVFTCRGNTVRQGAMSVAQFAGRSRFNIGRAMRSYSKPCFVRRQPTKEPWRDKPGAWSGSSCVAEAA